MRKYLNLALFMFFAVILLAGCAASHKPIDVGHVQSNVVKGKTTMAEVENMYGTPYNKGILKDGTQFFYYLYASHLTGASQDFTFYFDKNGQVANYATEYPGGSPLTSK